jgi:exosortase/archaeosortase family protein
LSSRPLWQKIIVVFFAVPIAISCNVMRVSGQGLLDRYVSHSLSENFAHQFVGLIMLIPAFLLILLVGWILDQIFVEQIDRRVVAIAPKVITRATAATPPAAVMAPNSAPRRSLASARSTDETAATLAAALTAEKRSVATPPPTAKSSTPPAAKPLTPPPAAKLPPRPTAAPRSAPLPRAPGAPRTFVPPPPSVRLAPRAPTATPKKRPTESGDDSRQQS